MLKVCDKTIHDMYKEWREKISFRTLVDSHCLRCFVVQCLNRIVPRLAIVKIQDPLTKAILSLLSHVVV